jgi:hypothetical protein
MMKKFAEAQIAFDISKPHPPVKNPNETLSGHVPSFKQIFL